MKGHGTKFPDRFMRAITRLLDSGSWKEAAKAAGVAESTLWRWKQTEEFKSAYREAKGRIIEEAVARLQKGSTGAVETLQTIMSDEGKTSTARVTAARTVLDFCFKAHEMENLIGRIEKLEHLLKSGKEGS